jgi:hypothetical protein
MADHDDLIDRVRRILWEHWDPIGVARMFGPDDEYDSYAPEIAGRIIRGATAGELADHLVAIERLSMGLEGDVAHATAVAEGLVKLTR